MGSYLCKCNKCNAILIDENHQTGSVKLEVPDNAVEMIKDDEGYWACPNCLTDEYLVDLPIK